MSARLLPVGAASLAALLALAGCAVVPSAPPAPPPRPAPAPPPPAPPPPPSASPLAWEEVPVAAGDWSYNRAGADSVAQFGASGGAPLLTLRCMAATRQIILQRPGAGLNTASASAMTIRTTTGALQWPAVAGAGGLSVTRPASDPGFDWIAFSRGRVSIEAIGTSRLIVPVWAEISRVVEDCRN